MGVLPKIIDNIPRSDAVQLELRRIDGWRSRSHENGCSTNSPYPKLFVSLCPSDSLISELT